MRNIHPTAIVDPKAQIADGVSIGPFSMVGPEVTIGENCVIHNHVTLKGCTTLGRGVQLFAGAVVGEVPQDLKYQGEKTTLSVGDGTVIREYATLHTGTALGGGHTSVGCNNLIMAYVHIAHDCQLKDNIVIANAAQLAGHVHVEDYARISGLAALHHFVRIGTCSFVAGCAKLSIDVPPFTLADGHPARIRGLNREGLKRRGLSEEAMRAMKEAYRLCFDDEIPRAQAYDEISARGYDKVTEVALFVEFLQAVAKGKHGRALEAEREVVPPSERDGRLSYKPEGEVLSPQRHRDAENKPL
jgi:UDP-N-acetylglucosamine acyltransferase